MNILVARNHGFVNCLLVLDYVSISMGIFVKVLSHLRKSSNMGTGYEKSPHFAGIEKIL